MPVSSTLKQWLLPILACPPLGRLRLGEETRLCIAFANTLRIKSLEGKLRAVWFHVPNEAKRSIGAAVVSRAMGLVPGVPDYVVIGAEETICLEFKARKGRQTENQAVFQKWANEVDLPVYLVRSEEDALRLLSEHGLLLA